MTDIWTTDELLEWARRGLAINILMAGATGSCGRPCKNDIARFKALVDVLQWVVTIERREAATEAFIKEEEDRND